MLMVVNINTITRIESTKFATANKKVIFMKTITVAKGDGIGPEIMDATLEIILTAGAKISIE